MCDRMNLIGRLQNVMSAIGGGCCGCRPSCCHAPCRAPCCGGGSLVTVYNAVLAIGQPPHPIAAFDKAIIAIGNHGPKCGKC